MRKYLPHAKTLAIGLVTGSASIWIMSIGLVLIGCKGIGYCGG